jgi:hypothetical protein
MIDRGEYKEGQAAFLVANPGQRRGPAGDAPGPAGHRGQAGRLEGVTAPGWSPFRLPVTRCSRRKRGVTGWLRRICGRRLRSLRRFRTWSPASSRSPVRASSSRPATPSSSGAKPPRGRHRNSGRSRSSSVLLTPIERVATHRSIPSTFVHTSWRGWVRPLCLEPTPSSLRHVPSGWAGSRVRRAGVRLYR